MKHDKLIWENKEYELPAKTLAIARLMDNVDKAKNQYESYEAQYAFVKELLKDDAKEVLNAETLEEIDLVTLTLAYNAIHNGYQKRIDDFNKKTQKEAFDVAGFGEIKSMADSVVSIDRVTRNTV